MRASPFLASLICVAAVQPARAEGPSTRPAGQITTVDAVQAAKVAERDADVTHLDLRSLPVVLDAINRHQDWHEAAQQAQERVEAPQLRSHLAQQLSALVPHVSKELLGHPTQV